jgi:hypothetical protein
MVMTFIFDNFARPRYRQSRLNDNRFQLTEARMTRRTRPTARPFTVAVCTICESDVSSYLLDMLKDVIRRCPHGVLATTECLLGRFTCATRPTGLGAMLVLQPCSVERDPDAQAQWVGPIVGLADVHLVCSWIAEGHWQAEYLPGHLRADRRLQRSGSRN